MLKGEGNTFMNKMGLNEIRERFLMFFESKGHKRLESASLVPINDPSLLLINSGMAPLKAYFTGVEKLEGNRATSCQKCIRTPDIENVGITARHGTFFEMLGNFSFGDYFKEEAIKWAWEFMIEEMEIPVDKLWITIYEEDDEARDIWIKTGVSPDRIVRMGKKDNFWEHGTGPCGPCSEIHYDRGEAYGCGNKDCKIGCECDRYLEVWNLVFTQFNKEEDGTYSKLKFPNIDTGMGLERLACVMQDVGNLFEVDTVENILETICKVSNTKYGDDAKKDISIRVITDHIRSTVMMVSDGVMPSNEGRGYVLRRLLRRAARHGKLLGIKGMFLSDIAEVVIAESKGAYPNLSEKQEYIKKIIMVEEEKFNTTIDQGLKILEDNIEEVKISSSNILDKVKIFKLHDTYGFPVDLTKEIALENGLEIDEAGFKEEMQMQRQRARDAIKSKTSWSSGNEIKGLDNTTFTIFKGYEQTETVSEIKYIIKNSELAESAEQGEFVSLILDVTPFYAHMGGQIADSGVIKTEDGVSVAKIIDCQKTPEGKYVHIGEMVDGRFSKGQRVIALIDCAKRMDIKRNHTATHLLQTALKKVLGNHVEQAGSSVDDERLRFDFSHFESMTGKELETVERLVNEKIFEDIQVTCAEMSINEAKKLGATALFGEKYGDVVRVVSAGDFSVEFCGGTHVSQTSQISMFKIVSEGAIAAGIRRIEALTGRNTLSYFKNKEEQVLEIASALKVNKNDVVNKVVALNNEVKETTKELNDLKIEVLKISSDKFLKNVKEVNGLKILTEMIEGQDANTLRNTGDMLRDKMGDCSALVLISPFEGKVNIIAMATKCAIDKGVNSGNIIREVAKLLGGGGGGRPDIAQAGGKDVTKAREATELAFDLISENVQ